MTVVGSCHICSAPALNTCASCGKQVCRSHYLAEQRICQSCGGTRGPMPGARRVR